MKKALFALTILAAFAFASVSCEKEPIPTPPIITPDPEPEPEPEPEPKTPAEIEDSLYQTINQNLEVPKLVFPAPANEYFRKIAYFPSYRAVDASGMPDSVLDHLDIGCFAFATFDANGAITVAVPAKLPVLVSRMHAKGKKVMLSFKGTSSAVMGELVSTREGRKKVVSALLSTIRQYSLDGVDNDWEYPSTTKTAANGLTTAKGNLYLMTELSNELHRIAAGNKLVTMATTSGKYAGSYRDAILDELMPALDWINVMTYDDYSTSVAGQNHASWTYFANSFNYWTVTRAFDKKKVVMGLPCYGRASGITQSGTTMGFATILGQGGDPDKDEAEVTVNNSNYSGTYTIYYNGRTTIAKKAKYCLDNGCGGYMFWEAGQDIHDDRSLIKAAYDAVQ